MDDMKTLYAVGSAILCRSGATTLAEIRQVGMPAILVPFPHAAHDHQRKNAAVFSKSLSNVAVIEEDSLNVDEVLNILAEITGKSTVKKALDHCPVTESICEIIKSYLK